MARKKNIHRREFLGSAAKASLAFTIIPRHVLGGRGFVAPSDKLTLAHIGCGTEGLREMRVLIKNPHVQIVAVCDPNKKSANRMYEAKLVIETAGKTGVSTHLLAWDKIAGNDLVKKMIQDGTIGTLKEIHNWSHRPMWPQWTSNPTDTPPVPEGFNWDL